IEIGTGDVVALLQYICPPSALQPIPAHLLSRPLLQRHHFLAISPDDPAAYLTWPSDHPDTALALLECVNPDNLESTHPDVRYAADPEAVYAHVRITPTIILPSSHPHSDTCLRLIFLWDQLSRSWRYHNSAPGSFSKDSHSDLSHAMTLFHSPDDFLQERSYTFTVDNFDGNNDDDAYWNAYSIAGDIPPPSHRPIKPTPGTDAEDAYWAQYSTVQGSADSTVPSPRPVDRQHQPQNPESEADQRIFVPSSELNPDLPRKEIYNPLAPPSPSSLSRKLAALPTRPDSPPLQEEDDDPSSASASATSQSPQSLHADFTQEPFVVSHSAADVAVDANAAGNAAADEALKSAIRGLFRLWRAGARSQQDFLALVHQATD
ncbi:hypothetical protein P691DRAFT_630850, partial [Macrolepiota fuliginosa MF-IS2]